MYFRPETEQIFQTHSEIRIAFPDTSFPALLTDEIIQDFGVFPITQVTPEYDPITQEVTELLPELVDDVWVQQWEVHELDPAQVDENLVAAKAGLMEAATAMRWDVMTGGISLPGGMQVGTTIDDQNRITSVVANATLTGLADTDEVDFKANNGWVRVTIGQIRAMAGAIGQHVQACYTAERTHHEAIDLLTTPEEINAYNVNARWPQ